MGAIDRVATTDWPARARVAPSPAPTPGKVAALLLLLLLICSCWTDTLADDLAADTSIDYIQYSIGALIVVQTGLLIALLIQDRRSRRAKVDAEKYYAEMTHAARLALAGEITASIVHEVTQPLSAILNNVETAELLLNSVEPDLGTVRQILVDIRHDDLRANEIVRRLRTLLRKRELQFEIVNINALASNALALILPDALRRNIVIRTTLEPGLPHVTADPVHLQQVLLNLIINAMDAMKGAPAAERSLDLRTGRERDHVEVSVIDTGHGMTQEQLSKAFDSFFTTKPEGMGLGLSIARSIIQAHGGTIWAENRESGGTVFRFKLPLRT